MLQRLLECVSPPWREWVEWELALVLLPVEAPTTRTRLLLRYYAAFESTRKAKENTVQVARGQLIEAAKSWPPHHRDASCVIALLEPSQTTSDQVATWPHQRFAARIRCVDDG